MDMIVTRQSSKNPKRYRQRVRQGIAAEQLIYAGVNTNTNKYLLLMYASAASLLNFKGYSTKLVNDTSRECGHKHRSLISFSSKLPT